MGTGQRVDTDQEPGIDLSSKHVQTISYLIAKQNRASPLSITEKYETKTKLFYFNSLTSTMLVSLSATICVSHFSSSLPTISVVRSGLYDTALSINIRIFHDLKINGVT